MKKQLENLNKQILNINNFNNFKNKDKINN